MTAKLTCRNGWNSPHPYSKIYMLLLITGFLVSRFLEGSWLIEIHIFWVVIKQPKPFLGAYSFHWLSLAIPRWKLTCRGKITILNWRYIFIDGCFPLSCLFCGDDNFMKGVDCIVRFAGWNLQACALKRSHKIRLKKHKPHLATYHCLKIEVVPIYSMSSMILCKFD